MTLVILSVGPFLLLNIVLFVPFHSLRSLLLSLDCRQCGLYWIRWSWFCIFTYCILRRHEANLSSRRAQETFCVDLRHRRYAHMDEFLLMKFEGHMAELLIRACPQYKKSLHVTKDGKKVLYVRLKRALYGCIRSAMLWYPCYWSFSSKMVSNWTHMTPV